MSSPRPAERARAALLALFILAASGASARAATLVYSNAVLGESAPCGCRENPLGGMVRKSNLLKKDADPSLLQLDAGDLLFDASTLAPALKNQAKVQAEYLLKAMDLLHHDAVVPGEKDFALGTKAFIELTKRTRVKFLAANLKKSRSGAFLPASEIFTRTRKDGSKIRIAVIGLVGDDLSWPSDLKVTSPIAAARTEVAKLRKKADRVIALTHEGYEADQKLAREVPGIDFIVGGHTQTFLQEPVQVPAKPGGAWIFQSSFRNQYIGLVNLDQPYTAEAHRLVGLDAGLDRYEGQPENEQTPMQLLVKEFKAAVAKVNTEEARGATLTRAGSEKPLLQTFPRCAECHLKQFDFWRKTRHADALTALLAKAQLRNKQCLSCHTVGLGEKGGWSELNQVATLKDKEDETRSHPMELEDLTEFMSQVHSASRLKTPVQLTRTSPAPTPIQGSLSAFQRSFAPVQCENCHGPGGDHPFEQKSGPHLAVAKDACLKCHTADQAPKWYTKDGKPDWDVIAVKRKQIACPAGEMAEEDL